MTPSDVSPASFRALRKQRLIPWRERRFALLFAFLLLSLVMYPYAESSSFGYYAFRTLGSAVILLTVYAVTFRRGLILLVLCLAVPALLQRSLVSPSDSGVVALMSRLFSLGFDLLVLPIFYRSVYTEHRPNSETIFGALSIYLLLGFTFASVYGLIFSLQPHAFYLDPVTNLHSSPDRFDLVYFSFGTMTELGTPGMVAISREVRSVSLLEAVAGILYLAVLISRLLSAYRAATMTVQATSAAVALESESLVSEGEETPERPL